MALLVAWGSVLLASGVKVWPGRHAAVGKVGELMHVESMQSRGKSGHFIGNSGGRVGRGLRKRDFTERGRWSRFF
jgi:hypothetical protein